MSQLSIYRGSPIALLVFYMPRIPKEVQELTAKLQRRERELLKLKAKERARKELIAEGYKRSD